LIRYSWPGNVRELEHTIERAMLLGKGEQIAAMDLPPELLAQSDREATLTEALSRRFTLKTLEQEYIKKVLQATGGNKTETANILGMDRTTLYRKLEELKEKD
ncbi:MAG: sigma-54-dependent Fis family transcriptional regulator, partial [Deltaproteobacteria bacterium]|nr:sigma-54-dependent Fis family transcriptional regulator [Deltaproteobacteria bacterium]